MFSKQGKITLRQAFVAIYICAKLAVIFQVSKSFFDFRTKGYGGHFFFFFFFVLFFCQMRT